jgi:signal transduction histidine kinase
MHRVRVGWLRKQHEIQRMAALETQRKRIARDIHDELSASLTQISKLSEEEAPPGAPAMGGDKRRAVIAATARQALQEVGEIVWANNAKFDTLENLVCYLREHAARRLDDGGMRADLDFPEHIPLQPVSGLFRHHVLLFLKEALTNVVKHSKAGEVVVLLVLQDDALELTVSDNGRGVAAGASRAAGNGLGNMRERAEQLGGTFEMESRPGGGTTVRLRAPLSCV